MSHTRDSCMYISARYASHRDPPRQRGSGAISVWLHTAVVPHIRIIHIPHKWLMHVYLSNICRSLWHPTTEGWRRHWCGSTHSSRPTYSYNSYPTQVTLAYISAKYVFHRDLPRQRGGGAIGVWLHTVVGVQMKHRFLLVYVWCMSTYLNIYIYMCVYI